MKFDKVTSLLPIY